MVISLVLRVDPCHLCHCHHHSRPLHTRFRIIHTLTHAHIYGLGDKKATASDSHSTCTSSRLERRRGRRTKRINKNKIEKRKVSSSHRRIVMRVISCHSLPQSYHLGTTFALLLGTTVICRLCDIDPSAFDGLNHIFRVVQVLFRDNVVNV